MRTEATAAGRRLLVVSHPCSVEVNQAVYVALQALGWEIHLVIPLWWRDGFNRRRVLTHFVPALRSHGRRLPVLQAGKPQRHLYVAPVGRIVRDVHPAAAFIEQEPFSVSAGQWSHALYQAGVPFGLQHAEDLDRRLPYVAQLLRRRTLEHAGFVAARSPRAAELITEVPAPVVPHPVADWAQLPPKNGHSSFVVGYAGRLVVAKGVQDLLAAVERLPEVRLLVVGDGPLRGEVEEAARRTGRVELLTGVRHTMMQEAYARMDVLVLPSRTTPTWTEQFGRVLVEALWSGVPVVGSDSGEIPWVIESTQGGLVFPEGDIGALAGALETLRDDPGRRLRLAAAGQARVVERFSLAGVARQMDELLTELVERGRVGPVLERPGG